MAVNPTGEALTLLVVSITLLIISWITLFTRVLVRRRIKGIGLDDWLMVAGLVLFTVLCIATITSSYNGVGTENARLSDQDFIQARKWFFFAQIFYVLSTVPIKASICVALLRITTSRGITWALYGIIGLATLACIVTVATLLAWCHPVAATWDPSLGTCGDPQIITSVSYFISAVSIITDWLCAILPAVILWNVQLSRRTKLSVALILAFGVVASSATIVRLRYLVAYATTSDYLLHVAPVATWSVIESGIGLTAGSLAALRPLMKYIPFLGGSSAKTEEQTGSGGMSEGTRRNTTKMNTLNFTQQNRTVCKAGDNGWDRLSDSGSQKYILQQTDIEIRQEPAQSHSSRTR